MLRYFETRRRPHRGEIPVPTMTPNEWMQLGTQVIARMQQIHRRISDIVPASSRSVPLPRNKKLTEPDSEADAFERAASCKKCKERKSGPMKGHKGCQGCMGRYFRLISTRPVKKKRSFQTTIEAGQPQSPAPLQNPAPPQSQAPRQSPFPPQSASTAAERQTLFDSKSQTMSEKKKPRPLFVTIAAI